MNQTRTFLMFALIAVAYFLFMAWQKDYAPTPPTVASASSASGEAADGSVPGAIPSAASAPKPAGSVPVSASPAANATAQLIHVKTDVLDLTVDTRGGSLVHADLLAYPQKAPTHKAPTSPPTALLASDEQNYFVAQNGLVSSSDATAQDQPTHQAVFHADQSSYVLADGQKAMDVVLTWQNAAGLKVTKTYTFKRGSYVIGLSQRVDNGGDKAWSGNAYEQLLRVEPPKPGNWFASYTNPEHRSFQGAAWFTGEKFEKLALKDFSEPKDPLDAQIKGGWAAMLRLYFVTAWIPPAGQTDPLQHPDDQSR